MKKIKRKCKKFNLKNYKVLGVVSCLELDRECVEENKILLEGRDGLLFKVDRYKGS